jgi:hypothetical protein
MKYLDWQRINPSFVESVASTRFSTEAATFLGLQGQGLPQEAQIKAAIAELMNAMTLLGAGAQAGPGLPTVTLSPLTLALIEGATIPCTVTVLDANQQPLSGVVVGLSTGDQTIATIEDTTGTSVPSVTTDASGAAHFLVNGVGVGSTTVTAVASGLTSSPASVVVGAGTPTLALLPSSIAVSTTGSTPLIVHLLDGAGNPIAGQVVAITSSNPAFATVPATVTTDATGSAQVTVTGVSAGGTTITASALGVNASAAAVVIVPSAVPHITIGYTDYITPYQSQAAAARTMAFIAGKINHKWKILNGLTPSGGYPSNVTQIAYSLLEQTKCYDAGSGILVQQGADYVTFCANNGLSPEDGYLHYIAGATMMPDVILSIDGSGNVTLKYDTETQAIVYGSAIGKTVTIAGNTNAALNGTWTVQSVTGPAVQGGSAIVQVNTPAGATGTGGTISRVALGNGTLPERFRTSNAPFTPSWHINPKSAVRKQYELNRLPRMLAHAYTGYGIFVDSMSENVFPPGATLEYNPANSAQYHTDLAALIAALRATLPSGSWRYQINTANYNTTGMAQLIQAAGSTHMESIITDHSPSQWPGTDQTFVAQQLAAGCACEILNDVSVADSEVSFGAGLYASDPIPPSGNGPAMRYTIQSWINALMVWDGGAGGGELAVNLWNDLWTKPSPDLGGIDQKWLGMLDYEFGVPTAAATTLVTGVTDPLGQHVSVQSRAYGSNLVVYRTTSSGTTVWGDTAAYVVTLPGSSGAGGKWQRIKSDGTLDVAISTIALRPMEGAMLVPAGGSVSLTPASGSVAVGQSIPLTVTVLDASGSAVAGQLVTLVSSVPADVTVPASVTTNAAGQATFNATGAAAGSSNVTATANTVSSSAVAVTVTGASGTTASDLFAADSIVGVAAGAGVASWNNDADNTRNASEPTQTLQPVFKTAVLNALPMVFYPSANVGQGLQYTSLAHSAITVFFVLKHPSGSSSSHHGVLHADPGYRIQLLDAAAPYTVQFTSHRSTTDGVWQAVASGLPGSILEISYDSSSLTNAPVCKLNGTLLTTTLITAPVGTQVSSAGTATIGNDPALGTNDAFYGYVGEISRWDGLLTGASESTEGQRLGTKWGIATSY